MHTSKKFVVLPLLAVSATLALAGCSGYEDSDDVVYCVDKDNTVVDQQRCDNDTSSNAGLYYFLAGRYASGLQPGTRLDYGLRSYDRFRTNDTTARQNAGLPKTGSVSTGKSISGKSGGFGNGGSSGKGGSAGKGSGFGGSHGGFGG